MSFFEKRKARQIAKDIIRHSRHVRNLKGDLMKDSDVKSLSDSETVVMQALRTGNVAAIRKASEALNECIGRVLPDGLSSSSFAEHLEILVVAVVVAMGIRTYFVQPYKIPTGSMEPTLHGIHAIAKDSPGVWDRYPMQIINLAVFGERYITVKAMESGELGYRMDPKPDSPWVYYSIGSSAHKIPRGAQGLNFQVGQHVSKGEVLWAGTVITGDHVFVDKIRWNFFRPKRGQVIVFSTHNIPTLPEDTHYIKRLIGLPCEDVSINPPSVLINGKPIDGPEGITRIERQDAGYRAGYRLPEYYGVGANFLSTTSDVRHLGPDNYFVLGDNTTNSRDSRYWGTVPSCNTIGPAFLVYWPYSKARWGLIR